MTKKALAICVIVSVATIIVLSITSVAAADVVCPAGFVPADENESPPESQRADGNGNGDVCKRTVYSDDILKPAIRRTG